ncbi:hypothetical protein BX600DRAFT_512091 [Xylariales sp. PMI_506]|nr:hypothetical protein BX600DRAFT_512091 [Xylariales sp. PMI_506]
MVARPTCGLNLHVSRRTSLIALVLLPSLLIWLYQFAPRYRDGFLHPASGYSPTSPSTSTNTSEHGVAGSGSSSPSIDLAAYPYSPKSKLTVNLVVASIASDNISWTDRLAIPNLNIVRYVSDNQSASHHPPLPKGREALMYHTYFYDYYDNLPDISILIHADESPWHTDPELWSSMLFTLSRLNLDEVAKRGYVNLRVSWHDACPDWIDTTATVKVSSKVEEPLMAGAFRANFGPDVDVPRFLGSPCCSQFAVTRETVHRRPRNQYAKSMRWLIETDMTDYIAGRTWEHMWSWLFKYEPVDCPIEWKTFCRMYGVCFDGASDMEDFRTLWKERKKLREAQGFFHDLFSPYRAARERLRIRELDGILDGRLRSAMETGEQEQERGDRLGSLYSPDL